MLGVTTAFLLWGGAVALELPVDVLPDLTAPTVTVLVEGHGMAPTDMEALVTLPIEAAMNGASGVRRVRSATAVGLAVIWVDFDWGEDIYRARQTVTEKLSLASAALPAGVDPPVLAPLSSIMGEIMFVALQSDTHDPLDLRTAADVLVRRRLLAVHGVSQVTVIGGARRQFEVLVDPVRLSDYALSLSAVEDALRRANRNTAAGFRQTAGQEYLIQGVGRLADVAEIGATVIDSRGTGADSRRRRGQRQGGGRPQTGRRVAQRPAGGHSRHSTSAGSQHARAHSRARFGARPDPGRAAGRNTARRAAVPAVRLHRAGVFESHDRVARRHPAGDRRHARLSREPARRRDHPAGHSTVAARRAGGACGFAVSRSTA